MNTFMTTLFTIINSSSITDHNYRIAYCLLEKNTEVEKMSIKELATECQVAQATLNKFFDFFDFQSYSYFRNTYLRHIKVRQLQMVERYNKWKKNYEMMKQNNMIFNDKDEMIKCQKKIINLVDKIYHSQRVIFIGSDEMIYHALRFQGDFCVTGKLVVKSSIYRNAFIAPEKDDFVILCSMTGRIIELNNRLLPKLMQNNSQIMTIGYYNYLNNDDMSLIVPKNKSEIDELLILEYYLESILYTYVGKYYVNR